MNEHWWLLSVQFIVLIDHIDTWQLNNSFLTAGFCLSGTHPNISRNRSILDSNASQCWGPVGHFSCHPHPQTSFLFFLSSPKSFSPYHLLYHLVCPEFISWAPISTNVSAYHFISPWSTVISQYHNHMLDMCLVHIRYITCTQSYCENSRWLREGEGLEADSRGSDLHNRKRNVLRGRWLLHFGTCCV